MSLRWLAGIALASLLTATAVPSWSAGFEAHRTIRAAIHAAAGSAIPAAVGARLEIQVGNIDPRIQLPQCAQLRVSVPRAIAPALTARVSCDAPFWTLYVPLQVQAWGRVVVAATDLAPNTTLEPEDLAMGRVDLLTANGGYLTDPVEAEGRILRVNIRAGAPIPASLLAQPLLVHRGETVVLTLQDNGITIRTNVVALQDGRAGESILVQNPESRKDLRATVSSAGGVEMRF
jgi:flagellar basal body P-ring formation protein FlgA